MKSLTSIVPAIMASLLFLSGCATVPGTGRHQVMLISPHQEVGLGMNAFEQLKQEVPISADPGGNAMLQRVGQRIATAVDLPDANWEFVLFESEDPNAFALPGGKIGVHTGLLPITRDDAGLATVIGHEIAHVVARHGAERLSQHMLLQTGGQVVGALTAEAAPITQAVVGTVYGLGAQVGVALPHNRRQESEADYLGLIYMARAGYNPEEAIDFWMRFAEYSAGRPEAPWFLRTHPVDQDRIRQIQKWLPEARAQFQPWKGQ
jgi:metalloendopeptidase OMA1, mitochondrial